MEDLVRREIVDSARRVVIKVGTRVLTEQDGRLSESRLREIGESVAKLAESGRRVTLVSSGAVGAGMAELRLDRRPKGLAKLQAVAAIGQAKLINRYRHAFAEHGMQAGQVLLTAADLDDRGRYLNVRNTLQNLLEMGAVPIVNENDTVAVDELAVTFGDNDRLAALVTNLLHASLLVILSDVDGLYDGPPDDEDSVRIPLVEEVRDEHFELVRDSAGGLGKGGMTSKLLAAKMVTRVGESAWVACGRDVGILDSIFAAQPVGTLFLPAGKMIDARKRWFAFSATSKGTVSIDAGAGRAIADAGNSLLPIGVCGVSGSFQKGDVVSVVDPSQREVARGLCNYSASELERIRGKRTQEIQAVLGYIPYEEVIHRDNLLVINRN